MYQSGLPFSDWQQPKAPVTPRSPSPVNTHTANAKMHPYPLSFHSNPMRRQSDLYFSDEKI